MKELDDDAKVWRVFNDESERIDAELVGGWTSTLDTLLIFAGLFSAVVATFLIQTAQYLQQDYSAVTASLLTEMVMLQRVMATGGDINAVFHSGLAYDSFAPSSRDLWLNGLWLASLALTLLVAFMAGLVKQWLHYYLADMTKMTPKIRACTRQFRYKGLIQWGVPSIIESLPILMSTSLLLFFIGLILFMQDFSDTLWITSFIVSITAASFAIYVKMSFLPVWKPQCPYKTSLSKVYNGLIKAIWLFVMRLPTWNEQHAKSYFKRYYMQSKRWITKLLSHGSSLRNAESEAIVNKNFVLQQNIITEMALNSTNPSVSAVALQSLAAFHMHQGTPRLPDSLIEKLLDLFRGCFQRNSSGQHGYSIASDSSTVERYSRAMLLFPDHFSYVSDDWERLSSFSPPRSLHAAVLLASAVRYDTGYHSPRMNEDVKLVTQLILDFPPMEISKVIPWHYHQFVGAIKVAALLDWYSADEREQLLVALVKRHFPSKALTLQEDLLIHCLYACHTRAGTIEPLMEQASTKKKNLETSADIRRKSRATLLRFIKLLPDIADCALSLGLEEKDQLLLNLLGMGFHGFTDRIYIKWDEESVCLSKSQPEFLSCVDSLIKLLNRLASSWEQWNVDVLIWLKVVRNLHNSLRFHGTCNEEVTKAIFHWLLVLSLRGQDCPGNTDIHERTRLEYTLFELLFPSPRQVSFTDDLKDLFIDSLRICHDFITMKQLVGLPPEVMKELSVRIKYLLTRKESCELAVLDWMDTLFHYFIERDPLRVDLAYPMTHANQHQTLASLINFAHSQQSHSAHWKALLSGWWVLVINRILKTSVNERSNVTDSNISGTNTDIVHANNSEVSIGPWDLWDVLWIYENNNVDPWDIRDVLWMFEMQIPFGGPLNLGGILRNLDRVLGL